MAGENWYLDVVRRGINPEHEANTSRYVHEVILRCFDWPFEAILPQASKRGFIDYKLEFTKPVVHVHVEVKPFGKALRDEMIRKYIVRRGPKPAGFEVGVLTNLTEWQVFVAGPSVKEVAGSSMALLCWRGIRGQADINHVDALIGYRQNGNLRNIRAAVGESPDVLRYLLRRDDDTTKAIRRVLFEKRDGLGLDAPVPQYDAVRDYVEQLLDDDWRGDCPFSRPKFRAAVCSTEVAEAVDGRVTRLFGGRSNVSNIKREIRRTVTRSDDLDDE